MRFRVLALDYDGTIAEGGRLNGDVREAVDFIKERGISVLLATGRIIRDLQTVAGDLTWCDAIVAENGAVISFPRSGRTMLLGRPISRAFLDELQRRRIQARAGECVIEADAADAGRILAVIREMEMPLALLFNRGRVMILPQAISKATGLRVALRTLRQSEHNALAIGDAENDHELLEFCEHGVAVSWGSPLLKEAADAVLEGSGPSSVAPFIREAGTHLELPTKASVRRRLHLGSEPSGKSISLAVRGRNMLISGDAKTGKSWIAGLLAEQLILQSYCVLVIDPEGDYRPLEALPGVIVFGGSNAAPNIADIDRVLRHHDVSIVADLSFLKQEEKRELIVSLLQQVAAHRRLTGLPHRVVLDEAHYFLSEPDVVRKLDLQMGGFTFVTHRVSLLSAEVLAANEAIIATRETGQSDVAALLQIQGGEGTPHEWAKILSSLRIGEAVLLPKADEACGRMCKLTLAPRLTSHFRHREKYVNTPVPDRDAFRFTRDEKEIGMVAHTLGEFTDYLAAAPEDVVYAHLQRGDFSRWIEEVFGESNLADQIRTLEASDRLSPDAPARDAIIAVIEATNLSLGAGLPAKINRTESTA